MLSKFTDETTLFIQGAKGKINKQREFFDDKTKEDFIKLIDAFKTLTAET